MKKTRVVKPRTLAVLLVEAVVYGEQNLDQAMAAHAKTLMVLDARDQAFVKALCYGCLRDWLWLQALLQHYLKKPVRNKERQLNVVLALGAYQLLSMRVADHAALNQTVAVLAELGKPWAKAMVNAVLRALQHDREQASLPSIAAEAARSKHPDWLLTGIKNDWPAFWSQIIDANNRQAVMDLRCNTRYWTRDEAIAALQSAQIDCAPIAGLESGIRLHNAVDVTLLPHFQQGSLSVQGAAAQLAAPCLQLRAGMRVLDACAAPGGKTAHILESEQQVALTAIDYEAARVALIAENLQRLRVNGENQCQPRQGDAATPSAWWDGISFDRILLDAPCSATGVISRHPEVRLLRQAQDIERLAAQQQRILAQLWPLLKSGGMLLYVTCSILQQENDQVIAEFVERNSQSVTLKTLQLPWGRASAYGWQILPGDNECDGFYYACLEKHDAG